MAKVIASRLIATGGPARAAGTMPPTGQRSCTGQALARRDYLRLRRRRRANCLARTCSVRHVNMTISLAFLAPKLVRAAVEGRLPHLGESSPLHRAERISTTRGATSLTGQESSIREFADRVLTSSIDPCRS
jgi:hypothetical protein